MGYKLKKHILRKLLLVLTLTGLIFCSCKKEDITTSSSTDQENTGVNNVTDYDGNKYATVIIGNQEWMAENLKVTHYADGTPIPHVTDSSEWVASPDNDSATAKAYCWYNNDEATHKNLYGALYTYATATNGNNSGEDVQGVCPTGWHLPNDADWDALVEAVGGSSIAGGTLKSTYGWYNNGNGTDEYGFSALPAGQRFNNNMFNHAEYYGSWWSSTDYSNTEAGIIYVNYFNDIADTLSYTKNHGFSVRCLRNVE